MKETILILLIMPLICESQILDPVEYMDRIGQDQTEIARDMWSYVRVSANGQNARREEKKRLNLTKTLFQAKSRVASMPGFKKDISYKSAMGRYYLISYLVIKEDYGKIVNLEEIAQDSYDLMEAYLKTKELANKKLDSAYKDLTDAQRDFAQKNNITLVDGSSRIGEKLKRASDVLDYYNPIYLIFFKAYKQEAYLSAAMMGNDVGPIEQSRNALTSIADEGMSKLNLLSSFGSDGSLIKGAKEMMAFYSQESSLIGDVMEIYFIKEDLDKSNSIINSKKQSSLTNEEIDSHNQLINDYNEAIAKFNAQNSKLTDMRNKLLNKWNKLSNDFMSTHMP